MGAIKARPTGEKEPWEVGHQPHFQLGPLGPGQQGWRAVGGWPASSPMGEKLGSGWPWGGCGRWAGTAPNWCVRSIEGGVDQGKGLWAVGQLSPPVIKVGDYWIWTRLAGGLWEVEGANWGASWAGWLLQCALSQLIILFVLGILVILSF